MVMLATFASGVAAVEKRLPAYNVDLQQTSVSGLSSGGFMATQFHVAFSSTISGAGVIAGGPYYCTQGRWFALWFYLSQCTNPSFWVTKPRAAKLVAHARRFAHRQEIDHLDNLRDDKVYIFSGTEDKSVRPSVVAQTKSFYQLAGVATENIQFIDRIQAGHAMITAGYGSACEKTTPPFINNCDYDQAGAILRHIYGKLNPRHRSPMGSGGIIEFSQATFIRNPKSHSLSEIGYAYVPKSCGEGELCRIHVVFHGCQQTTSMLGDRFYMHAGYNEWAATNNIIVLYPQLVLARWTNPNGCWDWWGYDSADYYSKVGPQMVAVMAMIKHLAGTN
jgi:poly(3-hydroxybutyrate) depolymerase